MTKTNKQDSFLIGHARRMLQCRRRQKEKNLEAYRNRVNRQQKQYRLRRRYHVLSENQTKQKLNSIITTRKANRKRQRRYRRNQSNEKKCLRQEKDRKYQLFKRQNQQVNNSNSNKNIDKQISSLPNFPDTTTNYDI